MHLFGYEFFIFFDPASKSISFGAGVPVSGLHMQITGLGLQAPVSIAGVTRWQSTLSIFCCQHEAYWQREVLSAYTASTL